MEIWLSAKSISQKFVWVRTRAPGEVNLDLLAIVKPS